MSCLRKVLTVLIHLIKMRQFTFVIVHKSICVILLAEI